MNILKSILVFSLTICFLSCGEKVQKSIVIPEEGVLTLIFDKNMKEYTLEDFQSFWITEIKEGLMRSYYSKLIFETDTLLLDINFIPTTAEIGQMKCSSEDDFRETNIHEEKIKIEMCAVEYPNLYTEYLVIWQDNTIDEKFKRIYTNGQFTLVLDGEFRNSQGDEKTKRKLKNLFKSLDVTYQKD